MYEVFNSRTRSGTNADYAWASHDGNFLAWGTNPFTGNLADVNRTGIDKFHDSAGLPYVASVGDATNYQGLVADFQISFHSLSPQ